jgi:hypothetical protein
MMDLYFLRKNKGNPLFPPERSIPEMVSMWKIDKGPIEDISQILARASHPSNLSTFCSEFGYQFESATST